MRSAYTDINMINLLSTTLSNIGDLWTMAGTQAIKLMGGPDVPFNFGRTDKSDNATCPMNGRLPDASLGK